VRTEEDLRHLLHGLVEPVTAAEGVDLVDLAVRGTGSRQLVKVIVDRKGGVDLATCQRLSQAVSARLDEEDPIPGRYALEVTSPGIDRPLEGRTAFDRVEGREVLVHRGDEERVIQVRGTVLTAEDDAVVLDVGGEQVRIAYTEIVKATQTLPW
jgi:ribosome maturation factor RimP